MSPEVRVRTSTENSSLDHRLNDTGWGLLFILTGLIWMLPPEQVPQGAWLFGVAAILIGTNVVRYLKHIAISRLTSVLGLLALLGGLGQVWHVDLPLVAICLFIIGASLVAKPLLTHAS